VAKPALAERVEGGCQTRDEGGQDHADDSGSEHQGKPVAGDRPGGQPRPGEHKRKLTDLKQPQPNRQRHHITVTEQAGQGGKDQSLACSHQQHQQQNGTPVIKQEGGIQEHSYRGEEEQPEDIPQGNDVAQRLMAVVRFTQDHAGDKRSQSERKAYQMSEIAYSKTDGGDRQQKQFP